MKADAKMPTGPESSGTRHLVLGTVSFAICFAAWGLISAFAPSFRQHLHLSASQTALLIAVPVLLGSLARLPMGMLTDRFGGRIVFSLLIGFVVFPVLLVPRAGSLQQLLLTAFFLGMAGSSFAVGVGYVSRWYGMERQGSALGVYGLGNIGQSAAVFLGPLVALHYGLPAVYRGMAAVCAAWAVIFFIFARNAPVSVRPKSVGDMFRVLARERLSWVLAAFYFLTFGGFVAFSIYLPSLLRDDFGLKPADAGFRTAGFVVLATTMRPLGGWLSDKIGGARVLSGVFFAIAIFALLLGWRSMVPFTVGALGCAALLGVGNGAVFQLVPRYFPKERATVTGLVGAMGGMGGFFPPLLLGLFRDHLGVIWPGFLLLSATALTMWWINRRVFIPKQEALEAVLPANLRRTADAVRAGAWATTWTALLVGAIVVGSRNLANFDPALVIYTFSVIFAFWGVVYHYHVWIQKPPTKVYWRRGWQLFWRQGPIRSLGRIIVTGATHIAAQTFIRKRSTLRWLMHQFIFWGCVIALCITFPLVFGWINFTTPLTDQNTYIIQLFGFAVGQVPIHSIAAEVMFHGLDIAAFLVIAGIALSLWRRLRDEGAQAVQTVMMDFFPLIVLFAISVTGLALTVSQLWLGGAAYSFLAILHAITVITGLLYLPFGKFFHIFQRPAQLGVKLYQQVGSEGEAALCSRCGTAFASRMHIDDLKTILPQLGFDYTMAGSTGNWQNVCPACKRKALAFAQLRLQEQARG